MTCHVHFGYNHPGCQECLANNFTTPSNSPIRTPGNSPLAGALMGSPGNGYNIPIAPLIPPGAPRKQTYRHHVVVSPHLSRVLFENHPMPPGNND